jgi:hypothetical protein
VTENVPSAANALFVSKVQADNGKEAQKLFRRCGNAGIHPIASRLASL